MGERSGALRPAEPNLLAAEARSPAVEAEAPAFEVVPTLHIARRRLVRPDGSVEGRDPVARARELAAKGLVCLVDFDGLRRNKADLDTLRRIADRGRVWADAGSRFATDAMDLLVAGAERVTLRWSALAGEAELREAHGLGEPGALLLGLEYRGGFVPNPALRGDESLALALARELGLGVVVIDLARAGTMEGHDAGLAARFADLGLERWFAGGIRSLAEVRQLEERGYRGCLVGTALLGGALR